MESYEKGPWARSGQNRHAGNENWLVGSLFGGQARLADPVVPKERAGQDKARGRWFENTCFVERGFWEPLFCRLGILESLVLSSGMSASSEIPRVEPRSGTSLAGLRRPGSSVRTVKWFGVRGLI